MTFSSSGIHHCTRPSLCLGSYDLCPSSFISVVLQSHLVFQCPLGAEGSPWKAIPQGAGLDVFSESALAKARGREGAAATSGAALM